MRFSMTVYSVLIAASLALTLIPSTQAQVPAWGRRYNKQQIERTIARMETNTDDFKRYIDGALNRSAIDQLPAEDRVWERVSDFERATNQLRARFNQTDSWWETRNEVQVVLQSAQRTNRVINRYRQYLNIRGRWNVIKRDLNTLARYYDLQPIR